MDIEWLQQTCLSWPATEEEVKWESLLCFMVSRKMFCTYGLDDGLVAFKVSDEAFEELSQTDGFIPAPYMARAKWVKVTKPEKLTRKELQQYLQLSYTLVKGKLTRKEREAYGL